MNNKCNECNCHLEDDCIEEGLCYLCQDIEGNKFQLEKLDEIKESIKEKIEMLENEIIYIESDIIDLENELYDVDDEINEIKLEIKKLEKWRNRR